MSIENAIRACASSSVTAQQAIDAWNADAAGLQAIGIDNDRRRAAIIGQCAHESARFKTRFENLNYSAEGLFRIFRSHFSSQGEANGFARQPERIANRVYADRLGNGNEGSGDGFRYRGRGFLQLTGRTNYRIYGDLLGFDLVAQPEHAADHAICWKVAAHFLARTHRSGRTLLAWADVPDNVMVTKGINGGTHGLQERNELVARAFSALRGAGGGSGGGGGGGTDEVDTAEWQALLLNAGFDPGPIDNLLGPRTRAAITAAEAQFGVSGAALLAKLREVT